MSGRVAVVTGAASGIGLGVANRLAADGIAVALLDRDGGGVTEAADALTAAGRSAVGYAVDVADRGELERVFSDVRRTLGPITILVTSAGIESFDAVADITPEKWDRILAVNLTGTFTCMQLAVPDMTAQGWGRIVTISSSSAQSGAPHMAHYVASKGGVIGLTKAFARRVRQPGHHRQHHPTDHRRHAHGQKGRRRGQRAEHRRHGEHGPDRAGRDARGHRRRLRLPVLGRGRLHHGPADRRQRGHVHLSRLTRTRCNASPWPARRRPRSRTSPRRPCRRWSIR